MARLNFYLKGLVTGMFIFLSLYLSAEDGRILNLKEADIRVLIGQVAEATDYNFIVDPRVQGKVTIVSAHAMDDKELYEVFLSILKVHGFAAVKTGKVVKIVPDLKAKQDAISSASEGVFADEMVTRIFQVKHTQATQLIPILRPLVPQYGHLAAYPPTNVIILSDTNANIERLVQMIEKIDQASHVATESVSLKYADSGEVVKILKELLKTDGREGVAQGLRIIQDERTNKVILSGDDASREEAKKLIRQLDGSLARDGNTEVMYLKFAKASELLPVLDGIGQSLKSEAEAGVAQNPVSIQADEATNALVVSAPANKMAMLKKLIEKLDIRREQVLVEAVIAEVALTKKHELGIQWAVLTNAGAASSQFTNTENGAGPGIGSAIESAFKINSAGEDFDITGLVSGLLGSGAALGIGSVKLKANRIAALIRALAADDAVNLLSTPTLLTLDNKEAEILVGQNVPFITGNLLTSDNRAVQSFERKDIGVILKITPHINDGTALTLEIEQEVSSLSKAILQTDVVTDKRTIKTTVMVEDEETIVLGGLIQDDLRENEQRVPILGHIPLIGEFFRSRSTERVRRMLMVFLRPKILREAQDAGVLSQATYDRMREVQLRKREVGTELIWGDKTPLLPEWGQDLTLPPTFEETYDFVKH